MAHMNTQRARLKIKKDSAEGKEAEMGKTLLAAPLIFGTAIEFIIQTGTRLRV